jgi:hypothetical protein
LQVDDLWQSPAMAQARPPARVRMKLGAHEFEAEGPPELIAAHFASWRDLVAAYGQGGDTTTAPRPALAADHRRVELFAVDAQRKLISLRHYPSGKTPDADAVLLLLYAFNHLLDENGGAIAVTRLQRALAASGRRGARLHRLLERYQAAGLVRRYGHRRGTTYQLTARGAQHAVRLAEAMDPNPMRAAAPA